MAFLSFVKKPIARPSEIEEVDPTANVQAATSAGAGVAAEYQKTAAGVPMSPLTGRADQIHLGVIQRQVDLPPYVELAHLENDAKEFSAILVSADGKTAHLAVLAEMATKARSHTIKQTLSRSGRYSEVKLISVTASVLHAIYSNSRTEHLESHKDEPQALNIRRGIELISQGIDIEASDIHIDVRSQGREAPLVLVRYRIHGALEEHLRLTTEEDVQAYTEMIRGLYQNDVIAAASVRTGNTFNPQARQEAMLKPPVRNAEVRFESMPEKGGFDVVMRINGYDTKSAARKSLEELGLSADQVRDLIRASQAPHGLFLTVGATGSGKTTTITTILAMDTQAKHKKRISLEIPPESDIPYLSQVPVKEDDLHNIMDGVMRSDPDVISAGEIRNRETALMAQDAAITGHLTFGTFHANGILATMQRLLSERIGFDVHILTMDNFLRAVLYQTLVETLCPDCKINNPASTTLAADKVKLLEEKFEIPLGGAYVRYRCGPQEQPCPRCRGTGVAGRTVVAEVLVPTRDILDYMAKGNLRAAMDEYRSLRTARFDEPGTLGKTYTEHALYKVASGEICADGVFLLENLWTYQVRPIGSDRRRNPQSTLAAVPAVSRTMP